MNRWLNRPYTGKHGCRRLCAAVLAEAGIPWPRGRERQQWARVTVPALHDVVVFTLGARSHHVGVCLGRGRFLHVEEGERSRIDRLESPLFAPRIEGIYRYTPCS